MKRTLAVAAAVAALLSAAPGAAQAASADKDLCKSGGFANYVDPTTDLPFKNQGRCVSFVNGGGVLVPVEEEPPVPVAPTAKIAIDKWASIWDVYFLLAEFQGQPNTTYEVTQQIGTGPSTTYQATTNADGLAVRAIEAPAGTAVTLSIGGRVVASLTTPAAPEEVAIPRLRQVNMSDNYEGCMLSATVDGLIPGDSYQLQILGGTRWPSDPQPAPTSSRAGMDGYAVITIQNFLPGDTAQVVVDGQPVSDPFVVSCDGLVMHYPTA